MPVHIVCSCSSFVGRISRLWQPQGISLGRPNCVYFPTIVHELGHAIGFYHEHSRPDRDEHVDIIFENIRHQSLYGNFRRLHPSQTDLLGFGYDYASIMHYRSTSFSVSRNSQTIVAKDPSIPIGGAKELSPLDIERTNLLYNCGMYMCELYSSVYPTVMKVVNSCVWVLSVVNTWSLQKQQQLKMMPTNFFYRYQEQPPTHQYNCSIRN